MKDETFFRQTCVAAYKGLINIPPHPNYREWQMKEPFLQIIKLRMNT